MTTSSILKSVWGVLEAESEQRPGVYERRVFAHTGFEVFAGLVRPMMRLRLSIIVPSTVPTDGLERETRGFRVHRHYVATDRSTRVTLELGHQAFRELFEVVAEDVATRILASHDESAAVAAMRERLNHWERFMRTAGPEGLSREDQIGLFGELTFLGTLLRASIPADSAVAWWKGPASENQDFQVGARALEVKTTTGNAATSVRVSNELQLDDTDCQPLFLLHVWLKELDGGGTSLPQLVDDVAALLHGAAAQQFADRLVQAGYHEVHRSLYEETGYMERARRYYRVDGVFPRIRSADLRPGVSKVKYWIHLAGFEAFALEETVVIETLDGAQV